MRERSRRYQPLPPERGACAQARKEDKSVKKRGCERRQWLKCINPPAPADPWCRPGARRRAPSRSCRTATYLPRRCGYSSRLAKIIVRCNFRAHRAGILRAFAYVGNCSRRMMYGFVARRVRSSYYGRLNEQFLSTFILSRIFPRENTPGYVQSVPWMKVKILRYYSEKHHVSLLR